jgi:hypothetical protein
MTQAEIVAHQGLSKCSAKAAIVASQHDTPVIRLWRKSTVIFANPSFYHPDRRVCPLIELFVFG